MKAHHDHKNRQDLAEEFPYNDLIQIILLLSFSIAVVVDLFVFRVLLPLNYSMPFLIRLPIVIILLVVSFYFARNGLRIVFGEKREKIIVISHGVFSLVRHPIYFGSITLYLSIVLITMSLLGLFAWIIIVIFYIISARYEEKRLLNIIGEDYRYYMNKVPMLFPILFRRK